jgi:hypothetical protein
MAIQIKKAVKYDAKLRLSIAGPSGSGKTWTSLTLATAMSGDKGICVIDTERGSASKYADLFTFDVIELDTFSPLLYVEAIQAVEEAGYGVLVIDSLSHAWNGTGGLLEIVENIAQRKYSKNTYVAWKDATPLQNALIDALTRANLHIIVTMRSKQEYVLEKNERTGKMEPRKAGMAPIQRDGLEYEFDVHVDMDIDNTMIVQKSRCSALAGQVIPKPDARVAETLKTWLSGAPAPVTTPIPLPERPASRDRLNQVYALGRKANLYANTDEFAVFVQLTLNLPVVPEIKELTEKQLRDVEATIVQRQQQAQQAVQPTTTAKAG